MKKLLSLLALVSIAFVLQNCTTINDEEFEKVEINSLNKKVPYNKNCNKPHNKWGYVTITFLENTDTKTMEQFKQSYLLEHGFILVIINGNVEVWKGIDSILRSNSCTYVKTNPNSLDDLIIGSGELDFVRVERDYGDH